MYMEGASHQDILNNMKKRIKRQNNIEKWGMCLNFLAPIVFLMNVPVAFISSIWLLCTGGLSLVLLSLGAFFIVPYAIGLLTYPAKLFLDLGDIELSAFLVALWHWLVASIWGYISISGGLIYGSYLSLPLIPTLAMCCSMCTLPFYRVLRDTLISGSEEAGVICIIIVAFVELSSLLSLVVFSLFPMPVVYIQIVVICSFIFFGVFTVPLHYIVLVELYLDLEND